VNGGSIWRQIYTKTAALATAFLRWVFCTGRIDTTRTQKIYLTEYQSLVIISLISTTFLCLFVNNVNVNVVNFVLSSSRLHHGQAATLWRFRLSVLDHAL